MRSVLDAPEREVHVNNSGLEGLYTFLVHTSIVGLRVQRLLVFWGWGLGFKDKKASG